MSSSGLSPYIPGHPPPGCSGFFRSGGDDAKPDECLGEAPLETLPPGDSPLPAPLQSPVLSVFTPIV
jgi:hypothetical protein